MSYLSPLRLSFAGRFQADVSTVNNAPWHFNNATFKPKYQEYGPGATNGWWNPDGTAVWRLIDCKVTGLHLPDGSASASDPAASMIVGGSDDKVAGKLVDLDSQQQLVSEVWGLQVRLTDGQKNYFLGDYHVAAFCDIWWARAQGGGGGDIGASAFYQSVIENLQWEDVSASPFLTALKAASPDQLSIKWNVDGFNMDPTSANFATGRLVGSIGPAESGEPRHFVIGRQFMPSLDTSGNPANNINFAPAVVTGGKVLVVRQ